MEYREEMSEFSSSLRQNVRNVGKKIKEFLVESGAFHCAFVVIIIIIIILQYSIDDTVSKQLMLLIFRSGTDLMWLLMLLLLGQPSSKSLRLCRFKSDRDEIWHDCSSSKYTLIDGSRIFDLTSYFQGGGH